QPHSTPFPYTTLFRSIIKRLLLYYDELLQLHKELNEYLNLEKQNWLKKQLIYFGEFLSFYDEMKQQASFIKDWLQQWHANYVHQDRKSTRLNSSHVSI